ncbi:MAG TPA: hypothetical protein VJV23_13135 [Candidatus Polarisedimenticolia bacterium]|nr:hypothetical protein [Candidatus Polarisedimenticolia bacterium]
MPTDTLPVLRVVARFQDGRLLKGTTRDFSHNKAEFHILADGDLRAHPVKVRLVDLKAVFFVKSLEGDKNHNEAPLPDARGQGRRIQVTFKDGEVLDGFTIGYQAGRPGFFLVPADPQGNNLRVYVVSTSVARVVFSIGSGRTPAGAPSGASS